MANQDEWMTRAPDSSTILCDTFDINDQQAITVSKYYKRII